MSEGGTDGRVCRDHVYDDEEGGVKGRHGILGGTEVPWERRGG